MPRKRVSRVRTQRALSALRRGGCRDTEIAADLAVDRRTLHNWRTGRTAPHPRMFAALEALARRRGVA